MSDDVVKAVSEALGAVAPWMGVALRTTINGWLVHIDVLWHCCGTTSGPYIYLPEESAAARKLIERAIEAGCPKCGKSPAKK